ncbi:MAG: hypothetical protein AABY15_03420 [Nanoarchaeota archaeon]
MAKSKKEVVFPILLDLHYKFSMNKFEEFYGESVRYSEIEQVSYIDLKDMVFEKIGRGIKFRKFGRIGNVLTIKMDITPSDFESFLGILKGDEIDKEATKKSSEVKYKKFNFIHDFTVSNIRDLTEEEKIKFKKFVEGEKPIKTKVRDSDDDDDDDELEDDIEEIEMEDLDSLEEDFDEFDEEY